jgi:hypothetical protein
VGIRFQMARTIRGKEGIASVINVKVEKQYLDLMRSLCPDG